MKAIFTVLALALPLASYAAQPIQTSTLTFSDVRHESYWNPLPADAGLTILSDVGGATTITTASWGKVLNQVNGGTWSIGSDYVLSMNLAPKAGYVITGFSFSATVSGVLETTSPPQLPGWLNPGMAANTAGISLPDGKGGAVTKLAKDVTDPVQYSFARNDLSIDKTQKFVFDTELVAYTQAGYWSTPDGDYKLPSYAEIHLNDPKLTIYTALAPVPEPEAWAMLLAGLAFAGVVARRRK
ncbi:MULTISPECIES: PEP-CTERM sorting domain-containing protein [unclassified Duganella]|uniref:PEP-CTERM sorting domain-containing protein n=1 Tax=unclassified Duganella TaxID=2636909 RepID=UPI000E34F2D2|nr:MULTISPECIES: PEP-CTERM sorting domain-containing protein [unclassified Duganella]RFP12666.1 PEP-CTERM sorting domain-containing protein [Duganella sp. BJB475]RFP28642.1 PEP-CTERM sorting domain-containing protein [Duganella sp. BJB476]